MKNFLFILFSTVFVFFIQNQNREWLPNILAKEDIIHHKYFSLAYFEAYELPTWVAYELTAEMASGSLPYKPRYLKDPLVLTNSSTEKDFSFSAYVMAQLVPVNDMRFNEDALKESFYMSTIVPQKPGFNKFTWEKLNNIVNAWAKERGKLYVISGPVLADAPFPVIGKNKVSVPNKFFKVILDPEKMEGIGIVLSSQNVTGNIKANAMTIRQVEEITGLNFFSYLDDEIEEIIEKYPVDYTKWDFNILDNK